MKNSSNVAKYYDGLAAYYDNLYTDELSQAENREIGRWLCHELAAISGTKKILDLGCGTGLGLELLMAGGVTDLDYVGIDISSGMVAGALQKFANMPHTDFLVKGIEEIGDIQTASRNCVTSLFGSFSHVMEYREGIAEIHRVLEPDGKLFLMVYSRYALHNLTRYLTDSKPGALDFCHPYDVRNNGSSVSCDALFYSPHRLRKTLKAQGFRNVTIRGLNMLPEIPAFKYVFRNRPGTAEKWLQREQVFLRPFPAFAHSLIAIAER